MSKQSSNTLFASVYEDDSCYIEGSSALDYTKTKNIYIDDNDIVVKPAKKRRNNVEKPLAIAPTTDRHSCLNKGAISKRLVPCHCNKCGADVDGILISYIHLSSNDKSIPFINYVCGHCGHSGYRSVQARALPAREFDRLYFS